LKKNLKEKLRNLSESMNLRAELKINIEEESTRA
jgi:hypothetical protein